MMQQLGATLSIRLMSVAPSRCIILLNVINLMLTLRTAMKGGCGSCTCLLLPDFSALTGKQKPGLGPHHNTQQLRSNCYVMGFGHTQRGPINFMSYRRGVKVWECSPRFWQLSHALSPADLDLSRWNPRGGAVRTCRGAAVSCVCCCCGFCV